MAFPASRGALSDVLEKACRAALDIRSRADEARARMAQGDVTASQILDLYQRLRVQRNVLNDASSKSGIGAYAQDQLGDEALDVAAEFSGMISEIDATLQWIEDNFPTDADGHLLARKWGAAGPIDRAFTPAQTSGLRARLDALAATVE